MLPDQLNYNNLSVGNNIKKSKHLTLNGRVFLYEDIVNQPLSYFELNTEFEKSTLQFCKYWLRKTENFEISTSGSTGKPKEITITRNQMEISSEMTANTFGIRSGDSILVNLNAKYIAGMMMLVRGLYLDLQITCIEPSSNPYQNINQEFDFYAFVPMQLQSILESGKGEFFSKAKAIIVGGAPISEYQENLFIDSKLPVFATYGMTETCTHIAIRKMGNQYFEALEKVHLEVDDRGCLIIHSPTAIKDQLITNDVIDLVSPQKFIWKGRIDNIINTGGIKIQIEELEKKIGSALSLSKQSIRFIITSKPDDKLGQKIILIAENKLLDLNSFESILEPYERPKEYHFIKQFPETNSGKIDRTEVLNMVIK